MTENLGPTPLNSWIYLTGQFEYTQREKNTKSTLKVKMSLLKFWVAKSATQISHSSN